MKKRTRLVVGIMSAGLAATATSTVSAKDRAFENFTPLAASAGPTADEALPLTLSSRAFAQRSIADRTAQLAAGVPNSGNWDMITTNESGPREGQFLFTVFETAQAGVQRTEIRSGRTETIWYSPASRGHVAFDASYWTPWGTFVTAEESWCTNTAGCTSPYGRLYELRNPVTAPAIIGVPTASSNSGADMVHQNVIPRVSHEGIQFDRAGNMYFIDELNGGSLYRYTPAASMNAVRSGRADYFSAGQTSVLRVGDGTVANAVGAYTWVPITDATGAALPGALTITDLNGVISVDGRNTTDLPAFKGTDYQRPEDLQIVRERGREIMFVATTTTNEVYRLDLDASVITVLANQSTTDLATGLPVGSGLTSPDNLAVDSDGNLYIIEDRNGGVDNDIWFVRDRNRNGSLADPGDGIGRWASNGTPGSELTGLYFDPKDARRAWVNIQHPASGNDRLIEITVGHDRDDDDRDDDREGDDRD